MLDEKAEKEVNATLEQLEGIPNVEISKVMLNISGPPCSGCRYWNPHVVVKKLPNGVYWKEDVVMCTQDGVIYSDFSCFSPKSNVTQADAADINEPDSPEEEDFALEA